MSARVQRPYHRRSPPENIPHRYPLRSHEGIFCWDDLPHEVLKIVLTTKDFMRQIEDEWLLEVARDLEDRAKSRDEWQR